MGEPLATPTAVQLPGFRHRSWQAAQMEAPRTRLTSERSKLNWTISMSLPLSLKIAFLFEQSLSPLLSEQSQSISMVVLRFDRVRRRLRSKPHVSRRDRLSTTAPRVHWTNPYGVPSLTRLSFTGENILKYALYKK